MSEIELITTEAQAAASIRERVNVKDISPAMGRLFGELFSVERKGFQIAGAPFAYYHSWSNEEVDIECGFPITGELNGNGRLEPFTLPSVRAVVAMHIGPYDKLVETYSKMERWMKDNGHSPADFMWEFYINDPATVPPEKLMTRAFWPIR